MTPTSSLSETVSAPGGAESADPAHRQRLETLGLLAAGITHDLNHLLTTIVAHAERAEAHLPPQHPARNELALVRSAAHRASSLARRTVQFGRPTTSERAALNLVALIEESLPLLRAALPRHVELRPHFDLPSGSVRVEPNQLLQVFFNLVLNAGQSLPASGGIIEVRVSRRPPGPPPAVDVGQLGSRAHLCLGVVDTGSGLDADTRRNLFDPFFTTRAGAGGTGLGLAIVRDIVLQHGGGIALDSAPGQGSHFRVYLPEEPATSTPAGSRRTAERPGGAPHIAVIDDEDTVVRLAEQALQFAGYRVSVVPSPTDCLAQLMENPGAYDLIITDQRMPGLSGVELLRQLRAARHTIPVIITSGSLALLSLRELQGRAPARFLPKPFTLADLLGSVHELVEAHRPQDA